MYEDVRDIIPHRRGMITAEPWESLVAAYSALPLVGEARCSISRTFVAAIEPGHELASYPRC